MRTLAYLDCSTGIAGDMCLGALVHAGVPLEYLVEQLDRLTISGEYQLSAELVRRNGQQATKVHVRLAATQVANGVWQEPLTFADHHSPLELATTHHSEAAPLDPTQIDSLAQATPTATRHLPEIERLIKGATLPVRAEAWSLAVFRNLAEAEGAVHGISPEQVHFHEVGATDAIVDIVGTCLGLDWLAIDQLYCSALPTGGGTVRAAHGRLPVPTPAVLKLWEARQVPIYSNGIERELVTPTGAAIVTTLAARFGSPPAMTLQRVGLGAGSQSLPMPNILRLWLGQERAEGGEMQIENSREEQSHNAANWAADQESQPIAVLETQIDDLNPQAIGYVFEALFAVGAVDVFTQAIGMKKSRPGILLSVICPPEQVKACESVLFQETTTLGIRQTLQTRTILQRELQSVQTEYGRIQVKVAWRGSHPHITDAADSILNVQPEYEDCAQIARQHNLPWREVHRLALQSWHRHHSSV